MKVSMKADCDYRSVVGRGIYRVVYDLVVLASVVVIGIWGYHFRDPHLMGIRDFAHPLFFAATALAGILSGYCRMPLLRWSGYLVAFVCASGVAFSEYRYEVARQDILSTPSNRVLALNQKLIVGYGDVDEVTKLVESGIAGIFLSRRNIEGETFESLSGLIARLQDIRKARGLPPLIVVTDQEGGPVSRLSPLVEKQDALAQVYARGESTFEYGKQQGASLRRLGVTVNFSPVVDLKPTVAPAALDFHTLIATRAISTDPIEVTEASLDYIRGLESEGVTATLKHFPGLSRIRADTHHFSALLNDEIEALANQDLQPFAALAPATRSWVMLSHVTLASVDPDNPVSTSKRIIKDLIKGRLNMQNTLITDDMTMGAIYNRGFCKSVRQSYSSGVDYLLIAYDYEKYYDAIICLI